MRVTVNILTKAETKNDPKRNAFSECILCYPRKVNFYNVNWVLS